SPRRAPGARRRAGPGRRMPGRAAACWRPPAAVAGARTAGASARSPRRCRWAQRSSLAGHSPGKDWKPVWNVLEDRFALVLANAQHVRRVPGRKTDVKDAEWLAELLRHGLIQGSFVPDRAQRELRELTRDRTSLVEERTAAVNRLRKVPEGANVK